MSWFFMTLFKFVVLSLKLWFKQMYTLKTVRCITPHAHCLTIHEMYSYDLGKLVICLSIDKIIHTST